MRFIFSLFIILNGLRLMADSSYSSCDKFGNEVDVEFESHVIIDKKFTKDFSAEKIKEAIVQQLRYARGYYINLREDLPFSMTLSAEDPQIEILKTEDSFYGQDMKIDRINHPAVHFENAYIKKALAKKASHASDPALLVTYKAKTTANYCGPKASMQNIKTYLPVDPYLAYWAVSPENRHLIGWRTISTVINPCADSELADIPDPFYYWYFWNPVKVGKDAKNKDFNCASLMKPDLNYFEVAPKLTSKMSTTEIGRNQSIKSSEVNNSIINISALFGIIDERDYVLPWKKVLTHFNAKNELTMAALQTQITDLKTKNAKREWDRGSQYFVDFLTELKTLVSVSSVKAIESANSITVDGKLVKSQQKVHLNIMFGYSDLLSQKAPEHWQFLKEAISNSDYIVYNGHSGLGENFKIANILDFTKTKAKDLFSKSPKYQMIAYFSCYSYGYFGEDIVKWRHQFDPGSKTDILLTGTEFTSARGPLGVLEYIDKSYLNDNHKIDDSAWLNPKDQLVLKSFSPDAQSEKK